MKECKCQDIREYIEDYFEGRLSREEIEEIDTHLNLCLDCRKEFLQWQRLFEGLTDLSITDYEAQPSPDFANKIMQKIKEEDSQETVRWWEKILHLLTMPRVSLKWVAGITVSLAAAFLGYNMFFTEIEQPCPCPNNLAEITFSMRADASQVNTIAVVGDFNDWDPTRDLLVDDNNDGLWTVTLKLEPGRYEYMFILDGQKWVPDPSAYRFVNDGFGNKNAVLEISQCN